ncbi:MAG: cytochrome c nitrite reductase small subunit [Bacteroidetes bacterium]|nr:cytochrome c nitrite reductase small subunit [Bacteroidota bacterium]
MLKFIKSLKPPPRWRIPVILALGIFAGLFLFAFYLSNAPSYLSDNPKTCVNCHIMAPQYTTWFHSAHREYATCNDCHVPHNNKLNSYYFKAKDGLRHATIFTLRAEPQVIFIKEAGINVVQGNCIRCHNDLITHEKVNAFSAEFHDARMDRLCWDCHVETPHGSVNSLSSVPYARVPLPESPVPDWLKKSLKNQ